MADSYVNHARGLESPGVQHYQLSASATELDPKPRAIRCEAAGTITLVDELAVALPYTMTAGEVMPFRAIKATVISAGTFYAIL